MPMRLCRLRRGSLFILIQADAASRRGLIQALALPVLLLRVRLECTNNFAVRDFGQAARFQVPVRCSFTVVVS